MLPKNLRLTKKRDFELVLKHGRWFRGEYLSLKVLKLGEVEKAILQKNISDKFEKKLKIAVSAGIKYSKKAVDRNRIRRQVFEAIKTFLTGELKQQPVYVMIVPNAPVVDQNKKIIANDARGKKTAKNYKETSFAKLSEEIKLLFTKAGLLNEKNI